jgi:hypothetical protein
MSFFVVIESITKQSLPVLKYAFEVYAHNTSVIKAVHYVIDSVVK